jgi:HEXXH motif-containing protein
MSGTSHRLPHDLFAALARGGGGPAAVRELAAAQYSKHVILLRAVLEAARPGARPEDQLSVAGYELLARVQQEDPAAAREVISYPSVGAWALHTIRGNQDMPEARPGVLAAVAAAAAVKAGLSAEIEVPVTDGRVTLPSLGVATAEGATAVVRTYAGEVYSGSLRVAMRAGTPGWRELRGVSAGALDVIVDDLDPFRMPATDGEPAGRLTLEEVAELANMLSAAWEVLDTDSAAEIAALVRVIVPYRAPEHGLVSTSSPQTFGTIAMSRQPDRYTCAETLLHEAQHIKLSALLDLVSLCKPDDGQRYYAPWREDPRPASGLIQGADAFMGVSGYWRRQCAVAPEPEVRERAASNFARWRDGAALVCDTLLSSEQLTHEGVEFTCEMSRLLAAWQREPVSAEALVVARDKADRHATQWQADHGALPAGQPVR